MQPTATTKARDFLGLWMEDTLDDTCASKNKALSFLEWHNIYFLNTSTLKRVCLKSPVPFNLQQEEHREVNAAVIPYGKVK